MTKVVTKISILILLVLSIAGIHFATLAQAVRANEGEQTNISILSDPPTQQEIDAEFEKGYQVLSGVEMPDANLYNQLLQIAYANGYSRSKSTIYSEMFVNITEIVIMDKNIGTLKGMEHLRLGALTSLNLSGNNMITVSAVVFEYMPNLTTINLSRNKLTSVELTTLTKLTNVVLSTNYLQVVDLTQINQPEEHLYVNVANNNLTSMGNIKLTKRIESITLNIISNNITQIDDGYFENYQMHVGVQGLRIKEKTQITTADSIKYFKTNIANCVIEIYKIGEVVNTLVDTISDDNIVDGNYCEAKLGVGEYCYVYLIDGVEIYDKNDSEFAYFIGQDFLVKPNKVEHVFEFKNKTYEHLNKVTGKVTVYLTAEEGASIYYNIDGINWKEGNTVICDGGGSYNIQTKSVIDGFESDISTILVKTSLNPYISDGFMLVLLLIMVVIIVAFVLPIISRYFFKR